MVRRQRGVEPPFGSEPCRRGFDVITISVTAIHCVLAAFAGYDLTMEAYRVALANDYRFDSYGDAMLIR